MQETRNNCFGSKNVAQPFFRLKQVSTSVEMLLLLKRCLPTRYVAVTFRHSCLPVFAWRRIVLRFFDPKQLLRISCVLWCYFSKFYQIILQSASFWCSIVVRHIVDPTHSFCIQKILKTVCVIYNLETCVRKKVSHQSTSASVLAPRVDFVLKSSIRSSLCKRY